MALDHLQEEEEEGWKAISSRPPQVPTMKVLKLQGRILLWQVIAWDEGEGWAPGPLFLLPLRPGAQLGCLV